MGVINSSDRFQKKTKTDDKKRPRHCVKCKNTTFYVTGEGLFCAKCDNIAAALDSKHKIASDAARYQKIKNVPAVCFRLNEQRKPEWIAAEELDAFVDEKM